MWFRELWKGPRPKSPWRLCSAGRFGALAESGADGAEAEADEEAGDGNIKGEVSFPAGIFLPRGMSLLAASCDSLRHTRGKVVTFR